VKHVLPLRFIPSPLLITLIQVALHAGPSIKDSKIKTVSRSQAVQYRLTDTGAIFFDRGTGGGVL